MDPFNQETAPAETSTKDSAVEEVFYDGRLPIRAFIGTHGLLYVLLFGWNLGLLEGYLRSLAWKVKLTSQRLVVIRGFISQKEEDIPLYRATDIGFEQTVAGRLLGTGVITLIAEDATSPKCSFPFIRPAEVKEVIRDHMLTERRRMKTVTLD